MPETKPNIEFDSDGVCSACRHYEARKHINWEDRKQQLFQILDKYRNKTGSNWDCIVPVSGGKDSTYITLKMLEFGMKPLCVTASTCHLSEIGRKNLNNLQELGVDHIEFTTNKKVRRILNKIGLIEVGDISWPEHVTIFTIPVIVAVKFNIPLIVWGENSQNEYGGPALDANNPILNKQWLDKYGGLLGLKPENLIGKYGLTEKDLLPYIYPENEAIQKVGVTGIFLGYFLPWDGYSNALIAQGYGFTTYTKCVEGSLANYENLDNYQTGIHDYFKFLKYGFGRATDIACLHIRRGRLSRNDAIELVKKHDGKFPWYYLGKPLHEILQPLDLTVDEFIKICDKFTNKNLFQTNSDGTLIKDKEGNLIRKFYPTPDNF